MIFSLIIGIAYIVLAQLKRSRFQKERKEGLFAFNLITSSIGRPRSQFRQPLKFYVTAFKEPLPDRSYSFVPSLKYVGEQVMPPEILRRQTIVIIASDTQQASGAMDAHRNSNTSFCRFRSLSYFYFD